MHCALPVCPIVLCTPCAPPLCNPMRDPLRIPLFDHCLTTVSGAFLKLIWDTDPQDPGILIHQEQEILIHKIKNEFGILILQEQEILILQMENEFGILILGIFWAILQRAPFFSAGR